MRRWQTVSLLLILLLRLPYASAQALRRCTMPDGRMVLTDEPCPGEERKAAPPQAVPQPVPRGSVPEQIATKSDQLRASASLKTLHKIHAATEVGINFRDYGQLVVEAKAALNEAIVDMGDSTLKKELQAAMQAYADALTAWNLANNAQGTLFLLELKNNSQEIMLDAKYKFPRAFYRGTYWSWVDRQVALTTIWKAAKTHLDRATQLAKSP